MFWTALLMLIGCLGLYVVAFGLTAMVCCYRDNPMPKPLQIVFFPIVWLLVWIGTRGMD